MANNLLQCGSFGKKKGVSRLALKNEGWTDCLLGRPPSLCYMPCVTMDF